jgi:glutamate/tyrosine decarboxylase-like PLP-dependent enzyme
MRSLEDTGVPAASQVIRLDLDAETREELWRRVVAVVEDYIESVERERVAPELDPAQLRALLAPLDFHESMDPIEAVEFAAEGLRRHQVHTPHPRYFGLFNPTPTALGIAADTLVAAFNPQLAAWAHSPFAVEVERHLIRAIGERMGYVASSTDGTFTTGGAEANHTAVLAALTHAFPEFARVGVRGLAAQPVFYASAEGHHSLQRAARVCGIGSEALREVPVDEALRMDLAALAEFIGRDRAAGFAPFLVVATPGTTNAGVIDPLPELAEFAAAEGLWFHVDAAWGGAAALVPELRRLIAGIEAADSFTFDAHKWLSVPMGAGLFITRHPTILDRTFRIETAYMPKEAVGLDVVDPHAHSLQWSRRFIGLKVFLSLLVAGWEGYAAALRHQTALGELLRSELVAAGWEVLNRTELPVVCFVPGGGEGAVGGAAWDAGGAEGADGTGGVPGQAEEVTARIVAEVVASGEAWISTTRLGGGRLALRACITNYRTAPEDVRALVRVLGEVRARALSHAPIDLA